MSGKWKQPEVYTIFRKVLWQWDLGLVRPLTMTL